jgi:hypothetical protein
LLTPAAFSRSWPGAAWKFAEPPSSTMCSSLSPRDRSARSIGATVVTRDADFQRIQVLVPFTLELIR